VVLQAQIDAHRSLGDWDEVARSIKAYKKLSATSAVVTPAPYDPRQRLSVAHNTPALAAAYTATVQAEVAYRKKRNAEDARKLLHVALEACPTYPVCGAVPALQLRCLGRRVTVRACVRVAGLQDAIALLMEVDREGRGASSGAAAGASSKNPAARHADRHGRGRGAAVTSQPGSPAMASSAPPVSIIGEYPIAAAEVESVTGSPFRPHGGAAASDAGAAARAADADDASGVFAVLQRQPLQVTVEEVRALTAYRLLLLVRSLGYLAEECERRVALLRAFKAYAAVFRLLSMYCNEKRGLSHLGDVDPRPPRLDKSASTSSAGEPDDSELSNVSTSGVLVDDHLAVLSVTTEVLLALDAKCRELATLTMCRASDMLRRLGLVAAVGASGVCTPLPCCRLALVLSCTSRDHALAVATVTTGAAKLVALLAARVRLQSRRPQHRY
jgi:hypothetical protein